MRITIEIDEKSGAVLAADSATSSTTGAINAGPAPALSGPNDSAPHPFMSRGAGMLEAEHAAALSAGPAAHGEPLR